MNAAFNGNLFELGFDLIPSMAGTADVNSDVTGDRVKSSNFDRMYYCLIKPAGSAGDDISFQPLQHTAASSGNSKALPVSRIFHKVGTLASVGQFTEVEFSAASSDFDLDAVPAKGGAVDLAADTNAAVIIVEVVTETLDGANGFKFVSMDHAGTDVSNSNIACGFWICTGNRYANRIPLTALS